VFIVGISCFEACVASYAYENCVDLTAYFKVLYLLPPWSSGTAKMDDAMTLPSLCIV
jgi:hypothetical protein